MKTVRVKEKRVRFELKGSFLSAPCHLCGMKDKWFFSRGKLVCSNCNTVKKDGIGILQPLN